MNSQLLYYEALSEFRSQFYKDTLTKEHLVGGEIRIDKLHYPDRSTDEDANFWGYVLEKNGTRYLLPIKMDSGKVINIFEELPIIPKHTEKVAYRGNVYLKINKIVNARPKAERRMSFREMVNTLSSLNHTNDRHRKLCLFLGFTQMMDRAYFRISSPPGFGKDSVVDTMGMLFGNAATIENPTIAKLEYMSMYKWLAVNEATDIKVGDWKNMEQFLLSAGAYKPEITKHSRAREGVKEFLDISNFSLSLLYNDIDTLQDTTSYIDIAVKDSILDRFPPFRLYGKVSEDFNTLKGVDVKKLVLDNQELYRDLIYTFFYYKQNIMNETHGYPIDKLTKLKSHRWLLSIGKLLRIVDLYCDTKQEFDEWVETINNSIQDYMTMTEYPLFYDRFEKKYGTNINHIREVRVKLRTLDLFKDKNTYLSNYNGKKEEQVSTIIPSFWTETKV